MDLMYPLGPGSSWNDNELRYSLRSFQQNLPQLRKVFIVGHRPSWLVDNNEFLEHIPLPDMHKANKDANLLDKILHVCKHTDISDVFLRASDDQVLLREPINDELCVRYAYDLADVSSKWWNSGPKKWKRRMRRTYGLLLQREKSTLHCDCHLPQPLRKSEVIKVLNSVNYQYSVGFCVNTLLLNLMHKNINIKFRKMKRKKLTVEQPYSDITELREHAKDRLWLGYNDNGISDTLKEFLQEIFPDRSKFEVVAPVLSSPIKMLPAPTE